MSRVLFIDWETYFDSKAGYGLREMSVTEYIRDARFKAHGLGYRFQDDERAHWVSGEHQIAAFLGSVDWPNTTVVAHNVRFDGAILAWRYGVKPLAWCDTVALAKAVLGKNVSSFSLKNLAEYLGLPAKGELTCDGIENPTASELAALGEYCKNDVELCKGIYEKLIGQFPANQLWHIDWTIRSFVYPKLRLDVVALKQGVAKEKTRREEAIAASGVDRKVLSSNKQFSEYLGSKGVKVATKVSARTGKETPAFAKTDPGLEALRHSHPCLYAARIAAKSNLLETRGEALARVGQSGSFPFDVGFSGALQTHRYSGGSGAGGNPQNFTRNSFLRSSVCAPENHQLIVGDFAAVELRILAWLANEPKLIHGIINNLDLYLEFGSVFFKRPLTKAANKPERHFGKGAILGLGYGMGGDKFYATVKALKADPSWTPEQIAALEAIKAAFTDAQAFETVKLYRDTYFNVPKLWKMAEMSIPLIATGRIASLPFAPFLKVCKNAIILPSGLKIKYPNLRSTTTTRRGRPHTEWHYDVFRKKYEAEPTKLYGGKVIENICQALAGELCKEAIKRAEVEFRLPCVGQVHDEVIAVTDKAAFIAAEALTEAMQQSPAWWPQIRLKAEVHTGANWSEAK